MEQEESGVGEGEKISSSQERVAMTLPRGKERTEADTLLWRAVAAIANLDFVSAEEVLASLHSSQCEYAVLFAAVRMTSPVVGFPHVSLCC